jgi:ubiquinone/menaquinone biosynthesis C-methylase UbiE
VFRSAFDKALVELGAGLSTEEGKDAVIVDFGCGTGTSTRRLAAQYPKATKLIGIDLSPYFIDVGNTLLKLAPDAICSGSAVGWIAKVDPDPRIQLQQGDIANTNLPSNFASVVNIGLVMHELPLDAAKEVVLEAYRILQPGGQLWISEMDFESPAYKAQRENAMLFSLLRATEPYLDEYADGMPALREFIVDVFSGSNNDVEANKGYVRIAAATGRHYALIAQKEGNSSTSSQGNKQLEDVRFLEDGRYALEDTHLKPWESKVES